jgi:hypothetical protein
MAALNDHAAGHSSDPYQSYEDEQHYHQHHAKVHSDGLVGGEGQVNSSTSDVGNDLAAWAGSSGSPRGGASSSGGGNGAPAVIDFDEPEIASLPRVLLMGPRRGGKTSIQVGRVGIFASRVSKSCHSE